MKPRKIRRCRRAIENLLDELDSIDLEMEMVHDLEGESCRYRHLQSNAAQLQVRIDNLIANASSARR